MECVADRNTPEAFRAERLLPSLGARRLLGCGGRTRERLQFGFRILSVLSFPARRGCECGYLISLPRTRNFGVLQPATFFSVISHCSSSKPREYALKRTAGKQRKKKVSRSMRFEQNVARMENLTLFFGLRMSASFLDGELTSVPQFE
jgi:hypothetical protein